jgi:tungstate transport system substrate-binding protein
MQRLFWIGWFGSLLAGCSASEPAAKSITMATTTSTRDSGLMDVLVPMFESESGIQVKVVAVGSGQALEMGRRGDVDLLLTHAPEAEAEFVEQGFGINRQAVMHNDFVLVGPADDPAGIQEADSVIQAIQRISQQSAPFVTRGDNSGTHMKERKIWTQAESDPVGDWYLDAGAGMADYSVILIPTTKHPHVNSESAQVFAAFLLADAAQEAIAEFGKDQYGQPLFFPDAR